LTRFESVKLEGKILSSSSLLCEIDAATIGFLTSTHPEICLFHFFFPESTPVSLLESTSEFEIDTHYAFPVFGPAIPCTFWGSRRTPNLGPWQRKPSLHVLVVQATGVTQEICSNLICEYWLQTITWFCRRNMIYLPL
jgi:hypothetical protein